MISPSSSATAGSSLRRPPLQRRSPPTVPSPFSFSSLYFFLCQEEPSTSLSSSTASVSSFAATSPFSSSPRLLSSTAGTPAPCSLSSPSSFSARRRLRLGRLPRRPPPSPPPPLLLWSPDPCRRPSLSSSSSSSVAKHESLVWHLPCPFHFVMATVDYQRRLILAL